MKTKKVLLPILFLSTTLSCQAMMIKALLTTTLVPPTSYIVYKFYRADGDLNKVQRFMRQDKNAVCTNCITHLQKECNSDDRACQEIIRCFENARSPLTQMIADDALQTIDDVAQAIHDARSSLRETQAYKDVKNGYCKTSEELKKPKKD